jgi:hypothetical protein
MSLSPERYGRGNEEAGSQAETFRQLPATANGVKKGLRKCRAVDSDENQKQVSHRCHKPLEIAGAIPTFPPPRLTVAMEKWKSKGRIRHFSTALFICLKIKIERRINPSLLPYPSAHPWIS